VNYEESQRAIAELRASPAARWIGNKFEGTRWIQKCTRCGVEQGLEMPQNIRSAADVPAGFDEKLYAWKRDFQLAHEGCVEPAA
jgi:hypothetical protein